MARKALRESMDALNNAIARQIPTPTVQSRALTLARSTARLFVDRPTQETYNALMVELRHLRTVGVYN